MDELLETGQQGRIYKSFGAWNVKATTIESTGMDVGPNEEWGVELGGICVWALKGFRRCFGWI